MCKMCYAPCYDGYSAPRDGHTAKDWFTVPTDSPLPDLLRGTFWLDGNWDPGLITFSTAEWHENSRTIRFKTYAPGAWASTTHLSQSTCCCGSYVVTFDDAFREGKIQTTFDWPCIRYGCILCNCARSCTCIADFKMIRDKADPDLWLRDSIMLRSCCGSKLREQYSFKRVLDAHGQPTKYYEEMIAAEETKALFVRTPCPAYCGFDRSYYDRQRGNTRQDAVQNEAMARQ